MRFLLNRVLIESLPILLRRFGAWWLKEFLSLLPERVLEAFSEHGRPSLVIAADTANVRLELWKTTRLLATTKPIDPAFGLAVDIERFIDASGFKAGDIAVGVKLPQNGVFCRQLVLPAQALGAIEAIIAQDLANKTPFKPADIYSDHIASEQAIDGKITIRQWIARRQYVDQALSSLKLNTEAISFITFAASDPGRAAPLINLRRVPRRTGSWQQKATWGLCCGALVLGLLAGGLRFWRQQQSIDRLDAEIAAVMVEAQQVRALTEELKGKRNALVQLRLRRNEEPGLIDLLDEVTRILPAHSWLTELRVVEIAEKQDRQTSIFGFSSAAPSLVKIIDGSSLLRDAALTSPIAFDAAEGRERFALQAMVRPRRIVGEAGQK